jgi:hypothetical protein
VNEGYSSRSHAGTARILSKWLSVTVPAEYQLQRSRGGYGEATGNTGLALLFVVADCLFFMFL